MLPCVVVPVIPKDGMVQLKQGTKLPGRVVVVGGGSVLVVVVVAAVENSWCEVKDPA